MGRLRRFLSKVVEKAAEARRPETKTEVEPRSSPGPERHPLDPVPTQWNQVIKRSPLATPDAELVRVQFTNLGAEVRVPSGTTILDAALAAEIDLNHYCGGMASCGSCRVESVRGLASDIEGIEQTILDLNREGAQDRLGCQTRILGDVELVIPSQDC